MVRRQAFTLVEILIVVIILGILAAIVLPKFSNASATARASMLADDLRVIRTQLEVFKSQHNGIPAGYPDGDSSTPPTPTDFVNHMTMNSSAAFALSDQHSEAFPYGPYLREMPTNPVNDKNTVRVLADGEPFPDKGQDLDGWIYQPSTMRFAADSSGEDDQQRPYIGY